MLCNCLQLFGKLESECVSGFFFFLRRRILLCFIVFLNSNREEGRKEIWKLSYLLY